MNPQGGANSARLIVLAGRVITPHGVSPLHRKPDGIVISDRRIVAMHYAEDQPDIHATILDFRPFAIAPGILDLHVHGGHGIDFAATDMNGLAEFSRKRVSTGTTGVLPTIALPWDALLEQTAHYGRWLEDPSEDLGIFLGLHIEGPFLNPRRIGALPPESLRVPSTDDLSRLVDASRGRIRMMTIAPELPGALDLIARMTELGIVASIGHTDATFEQVFDAVRAGARKVTHTFNAMRPFNHRDPGAVGGVLAHPDLFAELIADGHHVHPGALAVLLRAKGVERIALVTDNVPQAGLPDGIYRTGTYGDPPMVIQDGVAHLANPDGTPTQTISGSVGDIASHLRLVRNLPGLALTTDDLFTMASTVPANILNDQTRGRIHPGACADLGIWDESLLQPVATLIGGKVAWSRAT